jgi:hypothetical protein
MAIIPADEKVFMVDKRTNTTYGGSQALQDMQQWYTMQDVADSVQPYKVFTALLTQSGGDDPLSINTGTLTIGVTYFIDDPAGGDWTNVGAPNNDTGTYFVATGTTPNAWDDGTLFYNTGAPIATVLESTIGNVWFVFNANGKYSLLSDSLFVDDKTAKFGGYVNSDLGSYFLFGEQSDNNSEIFLSTGVFNGYLNNTTIEVRVYN